jgi:hypothetical protein
VVDNAAKDIVRVLAPIAQGDLALDEKVRDFLIRCRKNYLRSC